MPSPRIVQLALTLTAILFALTTLHRTGSASSNAQYYGTYKASGDHRGSHTGSHGVGLFGKVKGSMPPWLTSGSVRQQIQKNEARYKILREQREEEFRTYKLVADRNFFPCIDEENCKLAPFTFWDLLPATWTCPHDLQRLGGFGRGSMWLCGANKLGSLPRVRSSNLKALKTATEVPSPDHSTMQPGEQPGCIVYTFGIKDDSTFEQDLFEQNPNCHFYGYDANVDRFGLGLFGAVAEMKMPEQTHFLKADVAGTSNSKSEPPAYTIQDLMALNRHDHIDVLRLDVSGAEFESMRTVMEFFLNNRNEVPVAQLLIKIHLLPTKIGTEKFVEWWEMLEESGFRPYQAQPDLLMPLYEGSDRQVVASTYSFMNIRDRRSPFV